MVRLSIGIACFLAAVCAKAQDVHYAQVQDMNLWYNPALKTDKQSLVTANLRSVKYKGITSYTSKAATLELPLTGNGDDNSGFMNLGVGINANSTSDGTVQLSSGMLALSYALPLNYDNTYLAAGVQGAYTFSRISYTSYNYFPDKFDQHGPIGAALFADPLLTGYQYNYFTAGIGAAFFHNGEEKQWYIGGSVGNVNQPLTHPGLPETRLTLSKGIQAGYTTLINDNSEFSSYGVFNWQGSGYEHLIGARYTRSFGDSSNTGVFLGLGYRIADAVIPNIGLRTGKHRFTFHYELSVARKTEDYYNRESFGFSYRYIL